MIELSDPIKVNFVKFHMKLDHGFAHKGFFGFDGRFINRFVNF